MSEDKGGGQMKLDTLGWIAAILVIIGAINWGLIGGIGLGAILIGVVVWRIVKIRSYR